MTMNEWELFVIETDIEVGDTVHVLESNGKVTRAVFTGMSKFHVSFKDENKKSRRFRVSDMAEEKGYGSVIGLSKHPLSLKD